MSLRTNQSGSSIVELVVIVFAISVLGFVGYSVYSSQQTKTADSTTTKPSPNLSAKADDVANAPNISSVSDLDKASATLDRTNPSGSNNADSTQIDSEMSAF